MQSGSNPAAAGSIVALFVSGLSGNPYRPNGAISTAATPFSVGGLGVEVVASDDYSPLAVLYAGSAPGDINGLSQIDVQLPAGAVNPFLTLNVLGTLLYGTGSSNQVQVYAQ